MSNRIIITDIMRGGKEVPVAELKQMIGRGGRKQNEEVAYADVVLENDSIDYIKEKIDSDEDLLVNSQINTVDELSFHIVADIENGFIRTVKDIEEWYSRSFSFFQGEELNLKNLLEFLVGLGAIKLNGDRVSNANLGRIAAKFYFTPNVVYSWKKNFTLLFEQGRQFDDISTVWAMADVPVQKSWYNVKNDLGVISDFKSNVDAGGFEWEHSNNVSAFPYWTLIGGPRIKSAGGVMGDLKKNYGRMHQALMHLDKYCAKWGMADFFEELNVRVKYQVSSELVDLCNIEGVGKKLAEWLYNMDIHDIDDIRENADSIIMMSDYELKDLIEKIIK